MIVFTDGALEEDSKLGFPATVWEASCLIQGDLAVHPCLGPWYLMTSSVTGDLTARPT